MNITTMRNSKVYSITMPPEMGRLAERLAKQENRSMSELMREAFRRYQVEKAQEELLADPLRAKHLGQLRQLLSELRQEAKDKGLSKITARQIDTDIQAVRKARRQKKIKSSAK